MKSLRADLSSEGRYDILERVKPYRGGEYHSPRISDSPYSVLLGYSQEVDRV